TLSSGQRRRLALATAFVRPRKLLVLDEPEQRLDVDGVHWLANRLVAERQEGLAVIFASHEPHLVETVATRIVNLGGGVGGDSTPTDDEPQSGQLQSTNVQKAGQTKSGQKPRISKKGGRR